jgi:glycine dehydrogenase subunit 2
VSLVPSAGAHGELVGALIIRAYHKYEGSLERDEVIVPDSAHGTNPASAAMAGFNVVEVPSDENGFVDLESLKSVVSRRTAGLMITNPNTLGLFDPNILEIAEIVHEAGGLLYYDGANLNAILGKARPGDSGFDIVHMNLHKTFATPHGGGGPGAGPLAVTDDLAKFLPVPTVEFNGSEYYLNFERPHTIGRVRGFYGNIAVLLRAYVYILMLGPEGLRQAAELSVLNANYLASKIAKVKGFAIAFNSSVRCKHEFVVSASRLAKETGVTALHVSKRLLDLGFHAPTVYFPLIVDEALMIEPTETVSKEDLDSFAEAFSKISDEAYSDPVRVMSAPQQTSVTRIDEIKASHPKTLCLSWRQARMKQSKPSASPIKVV